MFGQNPEQDTAEARAFRFIEAVPDPLFRALLLENSPSINTLTALRETTGISITGQPSTGDMTGISLASGLEFLTITGNAQTSATIDMSAMKNAISINANYSAGLTGVGRLFLLDKLVYLFLNNCGFDQETLENIIYDLWTNKAELGALSCTIRLQDNPGSIAAAASMATEISELNAAGCAVSI